MLVGRPPAGQEDVAIDAIDFQEVASRDAIDFQEVASREQHPVECPRTHGSKLLRRSLHIAPESSQAQ